MSRSTVGLGGRIEGWSEQREKRDSDEIRDSSIYHILMLHGEKHRFSADKLINSLDLNAPRVGGSELRQLAAALDPLQAMGFDTLYLTGLFEKGMVKAKGISTPFCISDHTRIDQVWGNLEDLKFLIQEAHDRGMKIIVDLVFNHTAWDSQLLEKHPDYFLQDGGRILPGGFTDANRGGAIHPLEDVAQLDLSREDTRKALSEIIETLVGWGIDGFRVDMAAQTMNRIYDPRWHILKQRAMPSREFWAEIISTARRRNRKAAFFAETHGEVSARELYGAGFDVVTSKTKDVAGEDEGWQEAHASRDPIRITRAIEARVRMKATDTAAAVGFSSNHDTPSLEKTMGPWANGSIAMSAFMPPFLWVAGAEGGFDFDDGERYRLDELEQNKQFPLDADYEVDYKYDQEKLDVRRKIFLEKGRVFRELGGKVFNVPLYDSKREGWVGFEVHSAVKRNAPTYVVIGNPNTWPVSCDFGGIPPCHVWLINKKNGKILTLATP